MGYYMDFIGVDLWTALFVLLNTLTVIFVGTKFLFKPVMKMIETRQTEIDDMYASADAAEKNAKALENEYNEKLAAAKDTSERIIREAVARGQSREEEISRQHGGQHNDRGPDGGQSAYCAADAPAQPPRPRPVHGLLGRERSGLET